MRNLLIILILPGNLHRTSGDTFVIKGVADHI